MITKQFNSKLCQKIVGAEEQINKITARGNSFAAIALTQTGPTFCKSC